MDFRENGGRSKDSRIIGNERAFPYYCDCFFFLNCGLCSAEAEIIENSKNRKYGESRGYSRVSRQVGASRIAQREDTVDEKRFKA
jgi:hypothetical protein